MPAVARLAATLVRLHHAWDPERFLLVEPLEDGYRAFFARMRTDPDTVLLVATRDDAVVGYVFARREPRDWNALRDACGAIHDVFVDAAERRGGVGRRLLEAVCERLAARGAPRVVLMTAAANTAAQAVFARFGFRPTMIEMTRELPLPTR